MSHFPLGSTGSSAVDTTLCCTQHKIVLLKHELWHIYVEMYMDVGWMLLTLKYNSSRNARKSNLLFGRSA